MINKSKDNNQSPTFFILGCEQSADNHGAVLMKSIKKLKPNSNFVGIGGDKMKSMGLKSIEKIDNKHFTIHYKSQRDGLAPLAVGMLKGIAKHFGGEADITQIEFEDITHFILVAVSTPSMQNINL